MQAIVNFGEWRVRIFANNQCWSAARSPNITGWSIIDLG
jgi:hypothetical protein